MALGLASHVVAAVSQPVGDLTPGSEPVGAGHEAIAGAVATALAPRPPAP